MHLHLKCGVKNFLKCQLMYCNGDHGLLFLQPMKISFYLHPSSICLTQGKHHNVFKLFSVSKAPATLKWDNFEEIITVFSYNLKKLWMQNLVTMMEYVFDLHVPFCWKGSRDKISRLAKPLSESGVIGTCMISTCWSVSKNGRMGSGFRFCLGVYH